MNKEDLVKKLKDLAVVQHGDFTFTAGGKGNYYLDIKKALGDPEALNMITEMLAEKIPKNTTCVASGGYGGTPLAAALATKRNVKLALVREKQKGHGTQKRIDGYKPTESDTVAIVDDVFTTGDSCDKYLEV